MCPKRCTIYGEDLNDNNCYTEEEMLELSLAKLKKRLEKIKKYETTCDSDECAEEMALLEENIQKLKARLETVRKDEPCEHGNCPEEEKTIDESDISLSEKSISEVCDDRIANLEEEIEVIDAKME